MNAYELADFIDKYCEDNTSKEAAVLLRQQADRIVELEKLVSDMKYEKSSGVYGHSTKQLNNEEIANLWLFLEGKSEGVLQSGGTFNFSVEFYKAIKELEK